MIWLKFIFFEAIVGCLTLLQVRMINDPFMNDYFFITVSYAIVFAVSGIFAYITLDRKASLQKSRIVSFLGRYLVVFFVNIWAPFVIMNYILDYIDFLTRPYTYRAPEYTGVQIYTVGLGVMLLLCMLIAYVTARVAQREMSSSKK